ncbi:MAG: hypothetical protein KKA79_01260, partial [Nanoarchaeota archaeon]|nr:hypothetical protein [Nanoarchaeota archaeon]
KEYYKVKDHAYNVHQAINKKATKMYDAKDIQGLKNFTDDDVLQMFKESENKKKSWWKIFS